jgi:general secretion pathway protein G
MSEQTFRTQNGHSLLEVLVVIAILALLTSIAVPRLSRYGELGKENGLRTQIATVSAALRLFREDVGRFPTPSEGLAALENQPPGIAAWAGPYLSDTMLRDPWGYALVYRSPGDGSVFELFSATKPGWARKSFRMLGTSGEASQ